jgi:hypothetical protein
VTEVLFVAESLYDGTWGGGPVPAEIVDFELMRAMGWSWADLEATPLYVRRYCWDLLQARNEAEAAAYERAKDASS